LNLLRYDYVDLSQLIAKRGGVSDAKIARPKPGSVPLIDVEVFTLRSDIAGVARHAELGLRRHLGGAAYAPENVREGYALSSSVAYLSPRVDDMARMPAILGLWAAEVPSRLDGAGLLVLLGDLHRRARRVCGLEPKIIGLPGDCPRCAMTLLRRYDDDPGRIWCGFCNLQMTGHEYHQAQRMVFAPPVTPASEPR
jgi:hypothetical protein